MKITLGFAGLERVMSKVSDLVGDSMADESLRALIIATENNDLRFGAYNGNVTSVTKVEGAEMDLEADGFSAPYVMIRAKDITDLLSSFRSMKRTKVAQVELQVTGTGAMIIMHEEAASSDMQNADKYSQPSRFRVRMIDVRPAIVKEIQSVDMTPKGVQLESKSFLDYINALLPTVAKEKRMNTNAITFGDSVYTFLTTYLAVMPNHLPEELRGFRLTNTMAGFVKSFIGSDETFGFHKEEKGKGMTLLTLFTSDSVAVLKTGDMSQANDISKFTGMPENGVVVDKAYLMDVLKRLAMAGSGEKVVVKATIENGIGTLLVTTKNMKQEIPLVAAKGDGEFSFDIQGETLGNIIFSHTNMFDENVFLYMEHTADGRSTTLCCTDNTEAWVTRMPRLANVATGYEW